MALSPLDYAIIAIYFLVIVAIGFIALKFTKTKEDYLVAGRRLSFPLFFGCMAALALGAVPPSAVPSSAIATDSAGCGSM